MKLFEHPDFEQAILRATEHFQNRRLRAAVSGGLGSSTVHVDGATIVGQIKDAKCHCHEMGLTCVGLPSPMIACLNKVCDLVNCVIGTINGSGSDCQHEGADTKQTCEIAVGQPQ